MIPTIHPVRVLSPSYLRRISAQLLTLHDTTEDYIWLLISLSTAAGCSHTYLEGRIVHLIPVVSSTMCSTIVWFLWVPLHGVISHHVSVAVLYLTVQPMDKSFFSENLLLIIRVWAQPTCSGVAEWVGTGYFIYLLQKY